MAISRLLAPPKELRESAWDIEVVSIAFQLGSLIAGCLHCLESESNNTESCPPWPLWRKPHHAYESTIPSGLTLSTVEAASISHSSLRRYSLQLHPS